MFFFVVKRCLRPSYHKAPYHPVIVCTRKSVAKWEAGWTGDRASVWEGQTDGSGMLLCRIDGLEVDYGHIVRACPLPGGRTTGFVHDREEEPWTLLCGATWWSTRPLPTYLRERGVALPMDEFSLARIEEDYRRSAT